MLKYSLEYLRIVLNIMFSEVLFMKTKKANSIVAILICLTILFTVSCDMFTNSLLKGAARDMSDIMKNASTSELLAAGANPDIIGDPAAAQAAMNALAGKDLSKISAEDASNVCSLASSAILPVSTLMDAIGKITEDKDESEESEESTIVISSVLGSVPTDVNTGAIEQVLNNEKLVKETEIGDVTMATVSLMASSLAKKDCTEEERNQALTDISKNLKEKTTVEEVLAGTGFENDTSMKTAVKAALIIKTRDDTSSLSIGGFNLGEVIGVKEEKTEDSSN